MSTITVSSKVLSEMVVVTFLLALQVILVLVQLCSIVKCNPYENYLNDG
jgi:hypothetical protein